MNHTHHRDYMWRLIAVCLTVFIAILIPIYWYAYGPSNFLWLSDIGLFLTAIGLWLDSPLIISMATVGVLFVELAWNVDFFCKLILGSSLAPLGGIADYMFDPSYPLMLRLLSLFHIVTPIIWLTYLKQHGYEKRAFIYFVPAYWIILMTTYFGTNPAYNINWVFIPTLHYFNANVQLAWVILLFIGFPLFIFFPTHYVCAMAFSKK